jgi:hypothetical protein
LRFLYSTFGFEKEKVTRAMRAIPFDRLVVITSEDNTFRDEYLEILEVNRISGTPVETLLVDKFDLMGSFATIVKSVQQQQGRMDRVAINISGGTVLLADAALLAAFHTGAEAYHVDDKVIRLPVLMGATIEERLSMDQQRTLLRVGGGADLAVLKEGTGQEMAGMLKDLRALRKMGLVQTEVGGGKTWISLTRMGEYYRSTLQRFSR